VASAGVEEINIEDWKSTIHGFEKLAMSKDEENNVADPQRPDGFPSLATFIAQHRDHSAAIYCHYDDLAARNILYLQSELAELKSIQDEYDREDFTSRQIDAKERARDWKMFKELAYTPGNHKEKERMTLMLKIRATLKEYRKCHSVWRRLISSSVSVIFSYEYVK
jgi:hypothetical protein